VYELNHECTSEFTMYCFMDVCFGRTHWFHCRYPTVYGRTTLTLTCQY